MRVPMYKIIETYQNISGGHWFDASTMRFFNCRLPDNGYLKDNDYYFISSEKNRYSDPRYYTVRKMNAYTGNIETIGPFNKLTRTQARRLLADTMGYKVKDL